MQKKEEKRQLIPSTSKQAVLRAHKGLNTHTLTAAAAAHAGNLLANEEDKI